MASSSRIGAINERFVTVIKPEFETRGLGQHPNARSFFGRDQHGFSYDFADLSDHADVRMVAFRIYQHGSSVTIDGYRAGPLEVAPDELVTPLFLGHKRAFRLTGKWSLLRPFDVRFELPRKLPGGQIKDVAEKLSRDIHDRLPILHAYLYDRKRLRE